MRGYSAVALINSKKEPNTGGALRAAHVYDAALVVMQGKRYTGCSADTTKTSRHVPLIQTDDLFKVMPEDCILIAVEITDKATKLQQFVHPERAMYIFGPEDASIPQNILDKCKHVVYIPTKFCMNLAATVNVVLYDSLAKRGEN